MSEKRYYFFSDVHLGLTAKAEEKAKELKLVSFLECIREDSEKIYIVGDLFDCWIEYRRAVPKGYYRTLAKLNEIVEQGVEVNFLPGNHDFWLNTYLRDDVGLKLHNDSLETELDGKRFYLTHGDGLSKGDIGYKIVKRILRNRFNQFLYSLIHPDIGLWLAQGSSKKSRLHTLDNDRIAESSSVNTKAHGSSGMQEFARTKINEGFDFVIMGHMHKAQFIEITPKPAYYITLGDWISNYTYGVFSEGKFEIRRFDK